MTEELIAKKAEEFEFTNGTYAFKEAVKWTIKQLNLANEKPDMYVDFDTYTIYYNGKSIHAPKKIVQLIDYFMNNRNRVLSRHDILSHVWEQTEFIDERTVDVHIRKIKIALDDDFCIKCVKKVGYIWMR
jgi:DNA-binding response OmpR family regulator